ncbi:endospore germination permease [Paenibacillus sp. IHBB 10380]|uniref:endospore germination permease n=1 Tax=Paenibacillus sp. IHBB 10380 TaxID=1566358 RepID=UPI0005CFD5CC|nr:endospore germination permease [Paenibacillus sp. IHBB 10380]AJS58912.1 spore gernimation protein [Paenibacillus sp. IHBB 10380]
MGISIGKISIVQTIMILMLSNGLMTHVIINPMLLDASGRDSWISIVVSFIIFIPWFVLLVVFMRKSGQQKLFPWLISRTNPIIAWILIIPICIQLYLIGGTTVFHTTTWTFTNYLPSTPKLVLVVVLVIVCLYCAKLGITSIAIVSGILLPFVVLLGIFVSIANTPQKDYARLTPMLEHGWGPVFNGLVYIGGGVTELLLIVVLQHHLKSKIRMWQLLLIGTILTFISLGPIIGAITEFGPIEASKQYQSPYEQWRLVRLGEYIEHIDFLSVFQWLAGATIRISLVQYLLADLLPFKNQVMRTRFLLLIATSYILLSLLPISQNDFYLWAYELYVPATLCISVLLTLFFLYISIFTKPTKEGST